MNVLEGGAELTEDMQVSLNVDVVAELKPLRQRVLGVQLRLDVQSVRDLRQLPHEIEKIQDREIKRTFGVTAAISEVPTVVGSRDLSSFLAWLELRPE